MIVIKNAKLSDDRVVDVLIEDDKIVKIESSIDKDGEVLDAKGSYLLSGIVDLNVRVRDDILTKKHLDEIEQRAIKAGITTVVLNCDFTPSIENKTYLELLISQLKDRDVEFVLNIKGLNQENRLNNISILLKSGAKVISENSDISTNNLKNLSQYAIMNKAPLFIFCQNRDLNENGVINEAEVAFELGLPSISKIGEISEVAKVCAIADYYGVKMHLQTLSTRKSLDIAKQNSNITTEVSLHHLLKDDRACLGFNTQAKINPPLRSKKIQRGLLDALKNRYIDTITTLFSPQSITNKDLPFEEAKFGIDEMEEFLPLCYTYLVKDGIVSLQRLEELISLNPYKILNFPSNKIKEGNIANLLLFDPDTSHVNNNKNSIYHEQKIYGKVVCTIISGKVVNK